MCICQYLNKGEPSSNGSKTCAIYDKTGSFIQYYTEHKTPEGSIQKVYNNNGAPIAVQKLSKNGNILEATVFNEQNQIQRQDFFNNKGKIQYQNYYNNNGKLVQQTFFDDKEKISYINFFNEKGEINNQNFFNQQGKYIFSKPNNPLDSILKDFFLNLETLTKDDFYETLNRISEIKHTNYPTYSDSLYVLMHQYGINTGHHILEDIAEINPTLLKTFEDEALYRSTSPNGYKYTEDINKDIREHPSDYKKLSVDYQRLITRPIIHNTKKEQSQKEQVYTFNAVLDESTQQDETGNCYLVTGIKAMDSKKLGRELLAKLRKTTDEGFLITCQGNSKEYLITYEEILCSEHLSSGDPDMRVWELAMDKYRRDCAYENSFLNVDSEAGNLMDVSTAFFGKPVEEIENLKDFNLLSFNDEDKIFSFSLHPNNTDTTYPNAMSNNGDESIKLFEKHAYRITKVADNRVYFTNPWNDSEELSLSIDTFKNLENIHIEKMSLL